MAPYDYAGGRDSCIGCADIIRTGDTVVPLSDDRPDRLLCFACWWLTECDLPLPRWARHQSTRTNLAGVFVPARPADLNSVRS
ncbi:MAG: hypothetical protein Q8K72_11475 [Acidimicrobiales bacterium]|nr:hypothetical protein [Acidimicrobiales bacterium]